MGHGNLGPGERQEPHLKRILTNSTVRPEPINPSYKGGTHVAPNISSSHPVFGLVEAGLPGSTGSEARREWKLELDR